MDKLAAGKVLIGHKLRKLRSDLKLSQTQMAEELGISSSYLNLLENNMRPVTVSILFRLGQAYDIDLKDMAEDDSARLTALLTEIFTDPVFDNLTVTRRDIQQLASQHPIAASAMISLHSAYDNMKNAVHAGGTAPTDRNLFNPLDEVRQFQEKSDNYFEPLEEAAREFREKSQAENQPLYSAMTQYLEKEHHIKTQIMPQEVMGDLLREFDPHRGRILLSENLKESQRLFQIAAQLGLIAYRGVIDKIAATAELDNREVITLLRIMLSSYFAGAVMMPYSHFHASAQKSRYDLEALCNRYSASIEQVCHRLTTMNRPSDKGIPFFFLRVDEAGYVSKRLSAGGIEFARHGGACGRWIPHQAFRTPGQIIAQASVLEEGLKLLTIASTHAPPRTQPASYGTPLYAIALGCDLKYAAEIGYADMFAGAKTASLTPIGLGCAVCERQNCQQRGSPPRGQKPQYDLSRRNSGLFNGIR